MDRFAAFETDMWFDVAMEASTGMSGMVVARTTEADRLAMAGITQHLDELKEKTKELRKMSKDKNADPQEISKVADDIIKSLKEVKADVTTVMNDPRSEKTAMKALSVFAASMVALDGILFSIWCIPGIVGKCLGTLGTAIGSIALGKWLLDTNEAKKSAIKSADKLIAELEKTKTELKKVK